MRSSVPSPGKCLIQVIISCVSLKPLIKALVYLITVSAVVPYARVHNCVTPIFKISTQGSKLMLTPSACDSRPDT